MFPMQTNRMRVGEESGGMRTTYAQPVAGAQLKLKRSSSHGPIFAYIQDADAIRGLMTWRRPRPGRMAM